MAVLFASSSFSFSVYCVALVALGLTYCLLLALYRVTLHPLSKFPGPTAAVLTKWYECFYDTCKGEGGQYAWKIREMHEKYGPIVRINPDELHVQDPAYYDVIYAQSPAQRDKYPPAAAMMFCPLGTFGTVSHAIHRKRRLANSVLFSRTSLQKAQSLIYSRVDILCAMLAAAHTSNSTVHLHTLLLALTSDVASAFVLGRPFGCQLDSALAADWTRTMRALPRLIPAAKQFPWLLEWALKLPLGLVRAVMPKMGLVLAMYKQMHDESRAHAQRRTTSLSHTRQQYADDKPARAKTVFEAIDQSNLPEKEKDVDRQAQEAFVLISAGTETAARTMGNALYHLLANPDSYKRLQQELAIAIPNGLDKPDVAILEKLPFLTAVLKETLRVQQLMTSRFPLLAPNDLHYEQWTIPAGTPISMTISDVLSDSAIFESPYAFAPERWLDSEGQVNAPHLDRFFVPFGKGTRMCQGKDFAWEEMYICISQIVRKFEFELHDTTRERDVDPTRDCFLGTTTERSAGIRVNVTGAMHVRKSASDAT